MSHPHRIFSVKNKRISAWNYLANCTCIRSDISTTHVGNRFPECFSLFLSFSITCTNRYYQFFFCFVSRINWLLVKRSRIGNAGMMRLLPMLSFDGSGWEWKQIQWRRGKGNCELCGAIGCPGSTGAPTLSPRRVSGSDRSRHRKRRRNLHPIPSVQFPILAPVWGRYTPAG